MRVDDGIGTFYAVASEPDASGFPVESRTEKLKAYYTEMSCGVNEYYTAQAHGRQVETRLRIWQDRRVLPGDMAVLADGRELVVGRVYHGKNEDGLAITDVTLEAKGARA